ncbi:hypothetical protein ACA910_014692 [Epithemia clementina (nom. ined.)]
MKEQRSRILTVHATTTTTTCPPRTPPSDLLLQWSKSQNENGKCEASTRKVFPALRVQSWKPVTGLVVGSLVVSLRHWDFFGGSVVVHDLRLGQDWLCEWYPQHVQFVVASNDTSNKNNDDLSRPPSRPPSSTNVVNGCSTTRNEKSISCCALIHRSLRHTQTFE